MGCGATKVKATASNNLFCMSCIDGRAKEELMGSPGGDAGNIFRVLYSATLVSPDTSFMPSTITEILIECQKKFGHEIYFHTDDHAIHHFDPKTATSFEEADEAQNIGCGYFKLCATAPEKLEEDEKCQDLAKTFLKVLTETINKNPDLFDLVCLHGDHNEKYVKKTDSTKPLKADGQTFIYHPKVELAEGGKILDVVIGKFPALADHKDDILDKYKEVCQKHWEHAIAILAPGVEIQSV